MNHAVVVDANIAFKVVIEEELSDTARTFFTENLRDGRPIIAPPHFHIEVTNALHQRVRRRNITQDEAEQALDQFLQLPVRIVSSPELYQRAFLLSRDHRIAAVYDSLYVVLAQELQTEFWTADERLINSISSVASWVRWIGDYRPTS
jgi:predicted nucleic acid-binding protein